MHTVEPAVPEPENASLSKDHWSRDTIGFLEPHLIAAKAEIRIATGFFTVQGYNLLRSALYGKRVFILVGYDENSAERLKLKLIDDIMAHLALWDEANRREAVLDLVAKIRLGELQIVERDKPEFIDARVRSGDHAKLYIIDEEQVLVGSSNLTVNGLRYNYECVMGNAEPDRVGTWISWFNDYWNAKDTVSLTQVLLEALLRWLELVSPYDIYLKTILALVREDETPAPRGSYKMPVEYQQVVIERMLRQLKTWGGSFLVASTGLGKTVMATHTAYRLKLEGEVLNVMVFAPKQVHPDWERDLRSAGISYEIFTRDLLDQPETKRNREVRRILAAMEQIDERYIIFIDESQHFRNRINATGDRTRYSFERLAGTIRDKKPKVVLLTATPYAKGAEDLNNQLYLLPHAAPRNPVRSDGQMAFDSMADDILETTVWRVSEQDGFFDDFIDLPVSTVISTSQVAKNFATETGNGEFIDFGEQRRWLPQIEVSKIRVPLCLEQKMTRALDTGYFKHQMMSFKSRIGFQRTDSTIEQNATVAWMSSPLALIEVVEETLADTYNVTFVNKTEARHRLLSEIRDELLALRYQDDLKLAALLTYLEEYHSNRQKVIIFTERLATAVYLENALAELAPYLRVANAVRQTESGSYELKDFETEVYDLILDFAPEANRDKLGERSRARSFDVFISTDAYAAGVNLQDASVVISYDVAWTPETIIQRAGRILRFWSKPRRVSLIIFIANFAQDTARMKESQRVETRIDKLVQRTRQAERFSELQIIPEGDRAEYRSLGSLTDVTIEQLGLVNITEIEEFSGVSEFLIHITELKQNAHHARSIPDDIMSAMAYRGSRERRIYVLLRHAGDYIWVVYDVTHHRLLDMKEDELLNMIKCSPGTVPEAVSPDVIEELAQRAKQVWMKAQGLERALTVERICALYLFPESNRKEFGSVLADA